MSDLRFIGRTGDERTVPAATVDAYRAGLRGRLLVADEPGWDDARRIWNAMIDRRPAAIARCAGVADVVRSVAFARDNDLLVSVRGGGHNIAGNAVCDGGLMIDLSLQRSVRVDRRARRAHVEGGATLGDVDHETQAFGLATSLGINSTTGVAGLTLGGGFGWLARRLGLTVDNLLAADVVTTDAELVRADEKTNPDLFWALRGGGGNFGVVTRFEYRLHRVGPEVFAGLVVYPYEQARDVLAKYREFVKGIREDLAVWIVLRKAPPLPFLPPDVHGREILAIAVCFTGSPRTGRKLVEPVLHFGTPHGSHLGPVPFTAWQKAFDPLLTPGSRNYWKSHNFSALSDATLEVITSFAGRLPSPHCEIFLGQLGGAASRPAPDATAYAHRNAEFVLNVHGRWDDASSDAACTTWAREFAAAAAPHATGGVYVNFLTADETDRIRAAYGPNFDRLADVKRTYDPKNLFHMNQNVRP